MPTDNVENNGKTTKKQGGRSGAGFVKGQSGNPSGRPKQPKEFKELVKSNTVAALQTVIAIMNDPSAADKDRLKASELIIDRAYGKATQPIAGDADMDALKIKVTIGEVD